jgi:hypothetical protein
MKPKSHINPSDKLYRKFYVRYLKSIDDELSEDSNEGPAPEIQEKIISECKEMHCAFRFVNELTTDTIRPLFDGDKLCPFPPDVKYKKFFDCVHPDFLAPYLIYALCAYQAVKEGKFTVSDLYNLFYQIEIPIKLPGQKDYYWYLLKGRMLTIDERHNVTRHINMYIFIRPFTQFNEKHERKLIQGLFAIENNVNNKFHEILEGKVREHYKTKVLKDSHRKIIKALVRGEDPLVSTGFTEETFKSYKRDAKKLITQHTGYNFLDIEEVVEFLQSIKMI